MRDESDEGVRGGKGVADGTVAAFDLDAEGTADAFEIVVRAGLGRQPGDSAEATS